MSKVNVLAISIAIFIGWIGGYNYFNAQAEKAEEWNVPAGISCSDDGKSVVFSCAMHPQLTKSEKGACPICGMALTTSINKAYQNPLKLSLSPAAVAISNIEAIPVKGKGVKEKELHLQGMVEAAPERVYQQIAHLPGRIEQLYIHEAGEYIQKGQAIASVYSKELIAVIEAFEYSKHSESVLRSAENNLLSWKLSPERFKNMDFSKKDYRKAVDVYADFSGVITQIYVKEGAHATNTHMGHPTVLFDIADLSSVRAKFEIHESQMRHIRKGSTINVAFPALPGETFTAKVKQITPSVNAQTGYGSFSVSIDNEEGHLKPGMLAMAKMNIQEGNEPSQLKIPRSAVLWTGDQSVVYIQDTAFRTPVYECRQVQLGEAMQDVYSIRAGLEEGEWVVISGVKRLDAIAQLENKANMMDQRAFVLSNNKK